METKNKTVVMAVLDYALESVVWVDKSGRETSLKDAITAGGGSIEALGRDELLGAFASCQIRRQEFGDNSRSMTNEQLAERIKSFVLADAHEQLSAIAAEARASEGLRKAG